MNTEQLKEAALKATPGPWRSQREISPYPNWYLVYADKADPPLIVQVLRGTSMFDMSSKIDYFTEKTPRDQAAEANAAFIAAANPATILALLGCVEALNAVMGYTATLNATQGFEEYDDPAITQAFAALKKLEEL